MDRFLHIDAPIQAKKTKFAEAQKLKSLVTKNVNKSVEKEIRSRAKEGQINLSKAQQAVVKHHKDQQSSSTSASVASAWVEFSCPLDIRSVYFSYNYVLMLK